MSAPGKKALVIGATGIAGWNLCKYLIEDGFQVIGVARTERPHAHKDVQLVFADLFNKEQLKERLAPQIKGLTNLYFTAWIPASTPEEECQKNHEILKNTLDVVEDLAKDTLQHVFLLTGTKYYGTDIGPSKGYQTPSVEHDPRLDRAMFYYLQEDEIMKRSQASGKWTWSIARPDMLIGFSSGGPMNVAVTLAVYATIMKEMGQPLLFPNPISFRMLRSFSSIDILCKAIIWMSSNKECHNQAFNVTNDDVYRWYQIWTKVAQHFGMEAKVADKHFKFSEMFKDKEGEWKKIKEKHGLKNYNLKDLCTWDFLQFNCDFEWDNITSTNKAKEFGFRESIDSVKMFKKFFTELADMKIIPQYSIDQGTLEA